LAGTDASGAPLRLACVLGTRPEAIKLAPIVLAAREAPARFAVNIIATGQHRQMAASALAQFGLIADIDLQVMEINQRPTDVIARALLALPAVLAEIRPDVVLVQGDTSSTLAGAVSAYHEKIPVGHVEAGLRTDDIYSPFPEEMNRRLTSVIATFHFAPTEIARSGCLRKRSQPSACS
jgi:UDP-N-acetylglucosamine 2-epimerase